MEWDTYLGDKLSSSAREYYDEIRNQFESGSYLKEQLFILPVSRNSEDEFQEAHDALWALFYDEPLFFNHSYNYRKIHYAPSPSTDEILVDPGILYSRAQCEHIMELLNEELELLTSGCGNLPEYERAKLVYERVRRRYSYSKDHFYDGEKVYEPDDYTAAGAVLHKSCVCSGYAAILMLAFRRIGLPCIRVRGASHAWVMVKINGVAVHCDVTSEQLTPDGDVPFTYFGLCERDILKHIKVIESDVPRCLFTRYSYHERYHCFFSTALEAANYISAQFRKGERVVRVRLAEDGGKISTAISMGIRNALTSQYSWIEFDNLNSAIITKN